MNFCCENCGWSEIDGSQIRCHYHGCRTWCDERCEAWCDECCEAWKPKENAPTVAKGTNVPDKWVSVKDRMPETCHAVLVYTPHYKNIWAAVMHADGNWYIWSPGGRVLLDPDWYGPITHWMPLPEPPKED